MGKLTSVAEIKLNPQQKAAVKYGEGPLLIIAGAGTGKTLVITERIKHLITKEIVLPSEVLALTFTEKAAQEMEERVDIAMPYGYTQMWISTFHSFADRVLRAEALNIGLDPKYHLLSEAESTQFLRSNLFAFDLKYFRPLGNPTKFVAGILQHFSRLGDEDITPSEYLAWVKKQKSKSKNQKELEQEVGKWQELAAAYEKYEELKVKEGVLDFADLITKTLKLFRQRPNIMAKYRQQFKFILVDEFQDTNYAQNELAILLAGKRANITVAADDDQSIYRFRGAAVSNVLQFTDNFPKAKIVVLAQNYRSTQEILDRAYELIQHNNPDRLEVKERINKRLVATRGVKGDKIEFLHVDRVENEAEQVARKIVQLIEEEKRDFSDFAILVRANNHAEPFARALSRAGIPYQFLGPGQLFRQDEVKDVISYLKVLYNFEDSLALYRVLSMEHFDLPARDLASILNYARRFNLSLFAACEGIDEIFVQTATKKKIKDFVEMVKRHLALVPKETAGQLAYYFLQDWGLLTKISNPDTSQAEKRAQNISRFFDKLKTYEVEHQDASVFAVVDWIELAQELGESPLAADTDWTRTNAVNLLTVHSAKGLEFPVVFLVNLVGQRFPTVERREQIPIPDELIKEILPVGDYHLEEERRLFYVGMTRACDRLYFSAADYYGEGKREKRLSPFLVEALGEKVLTTPVSTRSEQLGIFEWAKVQGKGEEKPLLVPIEYISYSQIQTFATCPLHFKLKYILGIPTPPTGAQSFGVTLHATVRDFYQKRINGGKPGEKELFELYEQNWIREGYKDKKHEELMKKRGERYLETFLRKLDGKTKPAVLEQSFVLPIPRQGLPPLRVGGKIDRVDKTPGGLEIIDYKTGENIPAEKDIEKDLQLTIYALAATEVRDPLFNKKPDQVRLSLYFFEGGKKLTTIRSQEQLEAAKDEIVSWVDKMSKSDFKCPGGLACQNCEYRLMCRQER